MSENADLLVVLVDTNAVCWGQRETSSDGGDEGREKVKFVDFVEQLIVFLNGFLLLHAENQLCVIAYASGKSRQIWPVLDLNAEPKRKSKKSKKDKAAAATVDEDDQSNPAPLPPPSSMTAILWEQLVALNAEGSDGLDPQCSLLSSGLAMALSFINRANKAYLEVAKPNSRVLVLSLAADSASQYVSVMNCIFAAQKQKTRIDACVLGASDSSLLQQACDSTSGLYHRPLRQQALVHYFMSAYLCGGGARDHLVLPVLDSVDFRASCFCCRKTVDLGYVCSVCLSLFCKLQGVCSTCGTKFSMPNLRRPLKKRK